MESAKPDQILDCKLCKIKGKNLFEKPLNKTFWTFKMWFKAPIYESQWTK